MRRRTISAEHRSSDRDAEEIVKFHWPNLVKLGEFGKTEFKSGMADIWQALIAEGWTGQSRIMLGSDLSDDKRADRHADNPLLNRTDGSDFYRTQVREDREQELDFDR